ncbi:MAG: acyltransferase family protein [Polyangiaceae bacterium]
MAAPAVPLARARDSFSLRRFLELDLLDNRYPALHGLRVLGVVSVVQWHVTQLLVGDRGVALDPTWARTSIAVFFGMDLFFVLSGFLIGSILLYALRSTGKGQIRRFYLRRAFRTFPPYYLVLTFLVLTTALTAVQRRHLPFEYTYLTNYASDGREDVVMPWGWSLGLEEQFYLTVPLLFLLLQKIRGDWTRIALLGGLWISALVFRLALYFLHGRELSAAAFDTMYFRTHTRSDTLVAGLILAYVHARWREPIARWLERPLSRAMLAMPPLLCLWVLVQPWLFGASAVRLVHVFFWGTLTSIMYFCWLLLLLNVEGGWFSRVLSAPIFRRLATLGYGVYLVHIPVCDDLVAPAASALVKGRGLSAGIAWMLALAGSLLGSLALAYVLHVIVEKPSLALRDRVAR